MPKLCIIRGKSVHTLANMFSPDLSIGKCLREGRERGSHRREAERKRQAEAGPVLRFRQAGCMVGPTAGK